MGALRIEVPEVARMIGLKPEGPHHVGIDFLRTWEKHEAQERRSDGDGRGVPPGVPRVVAQIMAVGDVSWSAVRSRAPQWGACRTESRADFRDANLVARRD